MRRIIAALQLTVDGFIEGPEGELDWIGTWDDDYGLTEEVDTCVMGAGMYPGYAEYWTSILANPTGVLEITGQRPTQNEIEYARWADRTPHIVLSPTMEQPAWKTASVVRDIEEIGALKSAEGRDIYAVGGATFVSNLVNRGLVDELRLVLHPLLLGGGTALFKDVTDRHRLQLVSAEPRDSGHVALTYRL